MNVFFLVFTIVKDSSESKLNDDKLDDIASNEGDGVLLIFFFYYYFYQEIISFSLNFS